MVGGVERPVYVFMRNREGGYLAFIGWYGGVGGHRDCIGDWESGRNPVCLISSLLRLSIGSCRIRESRCSVRESNADNTH